MTDMTDKLIKFVAKQFCVFQNFLEIKKKLQT